MKKTKIAVSPSSSESSGSALPKTIKEKMYKVLASTDIKPSEPILAKQKSKKPTTSVVDVPAASTPWQTYAIIALVVIIVALICYYGYTQWQKTQEKEKPHAVYKVVNTPPPVEPQPVVVVTPVAPKENPPPVTAAQKPAQPEDVVIE